MSTILLQKHSVCQEDDVLQCWWVFLQLSEVSGQLAVPPQASPYKSEIFGPHIFIISPLLSTSEPAP